MRLIGIIAAALYMFAVSKLILDFITEQEEEDDKKTD